MNATGFAVVVLALASCSSPESGGIGDRAASIAMSAAVPLRERPAPDVAEPGPEADDPSRFIADDFAPVVDFAPTVAELCADDGHESEELVAGTREGHDRLGFQGARAVVPTRGHFSRTLGPPHPLGLPVPSIGADRRRHKSALRPGRARSRAAEVYRSFVTYQAPRHETISPISMRCGLPSTVNSSFECFTRQSAFL